MENNYHFYPFTPFEIATRNAKEERVKLSGGDYIVDKGIVINKKEAHNVKTDIHR